MRERLALFIAVRRSIFRAIFLADTVFAICLPFNDFRRRTRRGLGYIAARPMGVNSARGFRGAAA